MWLTKRGKYLFASSVGIGVVSFGGSIKLATWWEKQYPLEGK